MTTETQQQQDDAAAEEAQAAVVADSAPEPATLGESTAVFNAGEVLPSDALEVAPVGADGSLIVPTEQAVAVSEEAAAAH